MKMIYKYKLNWYGLFNGITLDLWMPENAEILKVAFVNGEYMLWALVEPSDRDKYRTFTAVGTGQPIGDDMQHLETLFEGSYVWHIMERIYQ